MLLLRRFDDSWMTRYKRLKSLWFQAGVGGLRLGKTGGKGRAVFGHAFDQKPAAMAVKNMFHQR